MDYLPEGFEELTSNKAYWKMKDMKDGENRLRIVQRPIGGWIDWKDKKPYRYKPTEKPAKSFDPSQPMRAFWSCYVWDYAREALFILEITQNSILKALTQYAKDEEWGDFTKYDIKIIKEGAGKETKYHVSPVPHKPMSEKILKALNESPVNLEALYSGGDPWMDFKANEAMEKHKDKMPDTISPFEADELDELIGNDSEYRASIMGFLKKNYNADSLDKMPTDLYDKVKQRALKNKEDREKKAREATELFGETFQMAMGG
jgi:hypothetical protein